ncbi:MAG: hypothetical protein H7Y32_04990, partial [Chloroflexales bacterium]|nr:hypothetical protein [Chloroflexales bacterium]
ATLPAWRGIGLYPRLLQAILAAESDTAARFWIAYLPENHASARGITKAGFRSVGAVVGTDGQLRLHAGSDGARGIHGAALLGLPHGERGVGTMRRIWGAALSVGNAVVTGSK